VQILPVFFCWNYVFPQAYVSLYGYLSFHTYAFYQCFLRLFFLLGPTIYVKDQVCCTFFNGGIMYEVKMQEPCIAIWSFLWLFFVYQCVDNHLLLFLFSAPCIAIWSCNYPMHQSLSSPSFNMFLIVSGNLLVMTCCVWNFCTSLFFIHSSIRLP
jgi:hypothetical protein